MYRENRDGENGLFTNRNPKHIVAALLIGSMLVIPFAAMEQRIPRASYEIINGEEINDDESVELTSSPFSPVSSVLLLNDSLLSTDDNWYKRQDIYYNKTRITRTITVPHLNVSDIVFTLSAFIVTGPLDISIVFDEWHNRVNTTGQTGEYCELVKHAFQELHVRDGQIWVSITFDGVDWGVFDHLYFSIEVEFTVSQCPVTIDLQRTNGESMYFLQEFRTIFYDMRPLLKFNEHEFILSQVNDTIFLPNGNYTLAVEWGSYDFSFNDIAVTDESLTLVIRIKSIRLDVESTQNIPGLIIVAGDYDNQPYLYPKGFYVRDSPSFYLPSGSTQPFICEGDPDREHTYHFTVNLQAGDNRNITLLVSENWILVGNVAFTPGRFIILIVSMLAIGLTILISRKKLFTSSIYAPFVFLLLGNILPALEVIGPFWERANTLPLYTQYAQTYAESLGISSSASSVNGSVITISGADRFVAYTLGPLSFILLLVACAGLLFEYLREELDSESPDFLIATPILCLIFFQWFYVIAKMINPWESTVTIGLGSFLTVIAFLLWFIQFKRKGKTIFQTSSNS